MSEETSPGDGTHYGPDLSQFVLTFEAAAAFRFRKERNVILDLNTEFGPAKMLIETEYTDAELPRTICSVKMQAIGPSLNRIAETWQNRIGGMLNSLAVATNCAVFDVHPLYVVDTTHDKINRDFFQRESTLTRPELPGETRLADYEAAFGFATCFFEDLAGEEAHRKERLTRAVQQYVLALRYVHPGAEVLAVAHAWMAAEALVPVARHHLQDTLRVTFEQLVELGKQDAKLKYMGRKNDPQSTAQNYARRKFIFNGDAATHKKAKDVSDGLEHGYETYDKLQTLATEIALPTLRYVRRAIIMLSGLEQSLKDRLLDNPEFDSPLGIHSFRIVTGTITKPPGVDEDRPPLNLAESSPTSTYDEETGKYKIEVNAALTATRDGITNISIQARP